MTGKQLKVGQCLNFFDQNHSKFGGGADFFFQLICYLPSRFALRGITFSFCQWLEGLWIERRNFPPILFLESGDNWGQILLHSLKPYTGVCRFFLSVNLLPPYSIRLQGDYLFFLPMTRRSVNRKKQWFCLLTLRPKVSLASALSFHQIRTASPRFTSQRLAEINGTAFTSLKSNYNENKNYLRVG